VTCLPEDCCFSELVHSIYQLGPSWSWSWSYGSWIYNYLCNQCLSPLMLWVRISIRAMCTTLCEKVCQWLVTGLWFSPGPPVTIILSLKINLFLPWYSWKTSELGINNNHSLAHNQVKWRSNTYQFNRAIFGVIVWLLDLQLPMQSVHIITDVVSSNLDQGEVHNIMWLSLTKEISSVVLCSLYITEQNMIKEISSVVLCSLYKAGQIISIQRELKIN
jgi:hypothetical protein